MIQYCLLTSPPPSLGSGSREYFPGTFGTSARWEVSPRTYMSSSHMIGDGTKQYNNSSRIQGKRRNVENSREYDVCIFEKLFSPEALEQKKRLQGKNVFCPLEERPRPWRPQRRYPLEDYQIIWSNNVVWSP